MTTQPEALRLATVLENKLGGAADEDIEQAAAELRQLHADVEAYGTIIQYHEATIERLKALNQELLAACKAALSHDQPYIDRCRAAIAKAEEKE